MLCIYYLIHSYQYIQYIIILNIEKQIFIHLNIVLYLHTLQTLQHTHL